MTTLRELSLASAFCRVSVVAHAQSKPATDMNCPMNSQTGALQKDMGAMLTVAEEIKQASFDGLGNAASGKILNGMFGQSIPVAEASGRKGLATA